MVVWMSRVVDALELDRSSDLLTVALESEVSSLGLSMLALELRVCNWGLWNDPG